jgi:hypothetical protein
MSVDPAGALAQSRQRYAAGYYGQKLEEGLVFQDVVTEALYRRGIVVVGYASRRFQARRGENLLGAEIKRDGLFRQTGNLYIETAEKAHPDNPAYAPSGIMREDNSWLYVIGDERTIYIFATKYLRKLAGRYPARETPTSRGFLMPVAAAETYCIRRIDLSADESSK